MARGYCPRCEQLVELRQIRPESRPGKLPEQSYHVFVDHSEQRTLMLCSGSGGRA